MRIIYKASLVFLLNDIYSKTPIVNAVILCNGKQNPYTRKKEGYYVFSNLYPGDYDISIKCKGYMDLEFTVTVRENETNIMVLDMPYAISNMYLFDLPRFEFTVLHQKSPMANLNIVLKLKNECEFLKLTQPAQAGNYDIKLNVEMISSLLGQNYIYSHAERETEIFLSGYDTDKKSYTLKNPLSDNLEPGGKFYPFWNIKTDDKGRAVMPLMSQFMKDKAVSFEIIADNLKCTVKSDIEGYKAGQVFYHDAKLRKSAAKK